MQAKESSIYKAGNLTSKEVQRNARMQLDIIPIQEIASKVNGKMLSKCVFRKNAQMQLDIIPIREIASKVNGKMPSKYVFRKKKMPSKKSHNAACHSYERNCETS